MKRTCAVLLPAFVLAVIIPNLSHAQSGYAVTKRGANYSIHQKTTVEHGTNQVHQYTELATGLNYTNSQGQLVESKAEIDLLPGGGAAAAQGQHKVYFPADIDDGVLEVVTPDGRHLKSRPLGVSYDDGSNTVFIALLTNSVGVLTASNQVTYPNAFTGFKADLVCTYRRGGFECDLVFRQQPPTPDQYGLDDSSSTLQLVTEFFNTQDPQEIPAASDDWYGLQDNTLKFGALTMTHGRAFSIGSSGSNSAQNKKKSRLTSAATGVYKRWLHIRGRTFLIEEVPLEYLADDLDTLPPTTNALTSKVTGKWRMASNHLRMPPAHEFVLNTKRMQIAATGLNQKPGVVLDYDEMDSDQSSFTFQAGSTYLISGPVFLGDGSQDSFSVIFEGGSVIKFTEDAAGGICLNDSYDASFPASSDQPVIFTSKDDNTVGETISDSSGSPITLTNVVFLSGVQNNPSPDNLYFRYAGTGLGASDPTYVYNCRFFDCYQAVGMPFGEVNLYNCLFSKCYIAIAYHFDPDESDPNELVIAQNVTADDGTYFTSDNMSDLTGDFSHYDWFDNFGFYYDNCLFTRYEYSYDDGTESDPEIEATYPSWEFWSDLDASCYQSAGDASYYLAPGSPYRGVGTTDIDPVLLAELRTMTTYAPQDGGWPDTNGTDIGYHYPTNEDSDFDGLPDWWEWQWFGTYAYSGTDLDGNGNTFLYDYQNGVDPDTISFTVNLGNQHFNTTNATGSFLVLGGAPSYEAVLVNDTNLDDAVWTNYDGITHLNLGPTDGVYQVWFGLKGYATNSPPVWMGTAVYLDRVAPQVSISNPTNGTVAMPYIQLQGSAPESLASVTYDLSNALAVVTNQSGQLLGGQFFDTNQWEYTTDYFQCYDVPLTNGLNIVTVHATDLAGNVTVTNFNYTLDYSIATNPVIKLTWPQDGMDLCQGSFTLRGTVDDPTATVWASITDTNGDTNIVTGMVERTGVVWVENLPLAEGTNELTLWVTNAAGLLSETNISVVKNDMTFVLTSISGNLWQPTVSVGGLISEPGYSVWVNGVAGTNNGDGTWNADNVPVSSSGVASFDLSSSPSGGGDPNGGTNVDKAAYLEIESVQWTQTGDITGLLTNEGTYEDHVSTWSWDSTKGGSDTEDNYTAPVDYHAIDTITPDLGLSSYDYYDTDGYVINEAPPIDGPDTLWLREFPQEQGTLHAQYKNDTEDRSSKVKVTLHTGGRSGSSAQGLFALTATAARELTTPIFGQGDTNFAPEQIKVGGQTLGSDGIAWKMYQDGTTADVTPTVSATMYSFSVGQSKYTPTISANGYDLSVTNPEFCVGQSVTFSVGWDSTPPYVNSVQHWSLPGKYVNEPYEYSYTCTSYHMNTDLLTNLTQQCWYVNKPAGTVSVGMSLQFANGQTVPIAMDGSFTIYRPTLSGLDNDGNGFSKLLSGLQGIMTWDDTVNSKYPGSIGVTQIINGDDANSDYYTMGVDELDGSTEIYGEPLPAPPGPKPYDPDDPMTQYTMLGDSPWDPWHPCANMKANFKDYIRFQPSGGIFVTLGRVEWHMNGIACPIGDISPNDLPPASGPFDDDTFPVWSIIY